MSKYIPLTNNKYATVSDEDHRYITRLGKWYARRESNRWFAAKSRYLRGRKHTVRLHTVLMKRILGHDNFWKVCHLNGRKLDCRRSNLQAVYRKGDDAHD